MTRTAKLSAPLLLAALVCSASGQVLHQDLKLLPADGAAEDRFGNSIAISGGVVAVGARYDDDNGTQSGSAYLFDAATGVQLAKLLPDDGAAEDRFGNSIAISGGVVAVGAQYDDDNGTQSGSAYLFDAATGVQLAKLLPDDGAAEDRFGNSIAISGGVVAVGANADDDNGINSGSAYLFDANTGVQLAKLLPDDGTAHNLFGNSIAISGGVVAVGANADDDNGIHSGSAYLFDAATGDQLAKLLPDDGASGDRFGFSIAISGGVVAVGAAADEDNDFNSGSAYLFDANTGVQFAKLLAGDGSSNHHFSRSIAIFDGVVAVGAVGDTEHGPYSGAAYLFDSATGVQLAKLLPDDVTSRSRDYFGWSIAISGGIVAVGAPLDNDNGTDSGSAYLFNTSFGTNPCNPADLAFPPGVLDLADIVAFVEGFLGQDLISDLTGDGVVDLDDFDAFVIAFTAGCP